MNPEQAIRDYLSTRSTRLAARPDEHAEGLRVEIASGGLDARPETIQFGKMRRMRQRELHAVTFETQAGHRMRFVCCVRQDEAGT